MEKHLKNFIYLSSTALALILTPSVYALPSTIYDNYIGGINHGYGDVIGTAVFDIRSIDVELLDNNMLSVIINTNFAARGDERKFISSTYYDKGIGYGDLFLSNA